jgi:hypothetical protein
MPPLPPEPPVDEYAQDRLDQEAKDLPEFADFEHSNFQPRGAYGRPVSAKRKARRDDLGDINENLLYIATAPESQFERIDPGDRELILRRREQLRAHAGYGREDSEAVMADRRSGAARARYLQAARIDEEAISRLAELSGASEDELRAGAVADYRRYLDDYDSGASADDPVVKTNRWLEAEIGKREAELQREEALPEGWSLTQGAARMAGLAGPNEPFSAFQATIQGVKETFGTLIQARAQMAEALGAPSIYAKPPKSSVFEQLKWRPKKPADTNRAYRSFPAALAEGFGVPVERGAPKASTMWQVDPETGETIPPNTVQFALDSLGGFTGAIANLMLARGAIAGLTRGAAARGAASFAARGTKGGRLAAALADDVPMFIASGIIGRALSGEKLTGEGGALDLDAVGVDALVGALNSGAAMAVNELAPFVARKTAKGRNLSQLVGEREAINRVSPQLAKMLDDMPPDSFAAKALASTIERALVDGTVRNSTTAARAVGDFATGYAIDKWNGIPEEEAVVQGILFSLIGLRHSQGRPAREVVEQVDAVRAARARGENVQLPPALAAAEADMRRTYEDARLQFNQAILGDEAFRDLGGDALWADETRRTFETLGREAGLAPVARDLEADAAKGLRETREAGIFYPTPDEKNVLRFFREDSEEAGSPFPGEKRLARALYSELPKGALEAHLASGGTIKSAALGHFKAFKNQEKSALAELKKLSESAFGGAGPKDFEDRSKKIQEKLTKARRGRDRWKNQLIDARLLDEAERAESEKAAKKVGARKGAGKSPDGEAPGDGGGPAAGPGAPVAPTSPAGSPPKPQKPIKVEKDLASIYNSLVHKHKKGTALSTKERGELQDAINKIQALGPRYDTGKFGKTVDEALTGRKPGSPATSATVAAPTSPLSTAREARAARFAPLPTEAATATKPVVAPGAEPTTPAAPTAPPPTSLRERLEAAGRDRETAFLAKARSQNALDAEENRRNIEQQDSETAALQKAVGKAEAKVRAKAEAVAAAELAAATGKPGATKTKKVEAAQKALKKSQKALAKAEADFEAARDEMNDLDEERDYLATNPVPATDQLRAVYQSLADAADRVESDSDAFLLEEAARNAQDVFSRYNLERKSSNPSRLRTLLDKVEPAEEEVVGPTDEQLAAAKRRNEAQVRREAEDARAAAEEAQAALEKALAEEDEGNIADAEDVLAEAKAKLKAAEADLAQGRAEDAGGSEPAPVAPSSPKEAATTPELLKLDKAEKEALRKFYDLESEIKDRRSLLKSYQGALGESGGRLPKELGGGKITQEETRDLTSAVRDLEEEKDSILENIFEIRKDILKSSKDSSPDFGIGYIVKLTEDKNKAKKKRDTISAEIKDIQSRVMSYQISTDLGLRIPKEIIHGKLIDPEEYTKNSESRLSGLHKEDDDISIRLVEMQKAIDEYNKSRFKDPDLLAAKPESVAPAPTSTRISPAKAAVEAVAADPALTPETKAAVEAVAAEAQRIEAKTPQDVESALQAVEEARPAAVAPSALAPAKTMREAYDRAVAAGVEIPAEIRAAAEKLSGEEYVDYFDLRIKRSKDKAPGIPSFEQLYPEIKKTESNSETLWGENSPEPLSVNNGWKFHLSTFNPIKVSEILNSLGLNHKIGRHSDQPGKDVTVYVGSMDAAKKAAEAIQKYADPYLVEPYATVKTVEGNEGDLSFTSKVSGRFSVPLLDKEFYRYGPNGIPVVMRDKRNQNKYITGPDGKPVRQPKIESNEFYNTRSHPTLVDKYGEYYTGTGAGPLDRVPGIGKGAPESTPQAAPPSEPERFVGAAPAEPSRPAEPEPVSEARQALTEAGALPENNAAKEPTPEQMAQAEEVQRAEREDYERRVAEEEAERRVAEEEAERLRLDEERQVATATEESVARPAEASVPEPAPVVEPAKVAAEIDIKGGKGPVAYWYSESLKRKTSEAERAGFAPDKVGVVRAIVGDVAEVMTRKGKVMRVPVADLLTDGSAAGFRDPEGVNWRSAYKMDSTVRWQSPSTKETFTGRIVDRDMRVRLHSPGAVEEPHVRIAFEAKRDGAPLKKTEWIPESHISLAIIRPEKSPKLVGEAVDQAVAERVWKDVAAKKGRREDWRVDLRQLLLNQPRLDSAVRTPWPNRAEFRDNSDAALPHIALLAELQKTAGHDFGTRFVNDFLTAPKYGNRELDRATAALIKYSNDIGFERLDFESLVDFQFARDLAVAWKNAHDANKIQGAPKIIHPVDKLLQTGETVLGKKFDALLERVHETLKASYRASDSIAKSINDTFIKLHGKGRC